MKNILEIKKVTRGGQITLPKIFRQKYNIAIGDLVEIIEEDGKIILQPIKPINKMSRKEAARELIKLLSKTGDLAPEISEEALIKMVDLERKKMRKSK